MRLKHWIFRIVFILLLIACLAICTYVNLADCAANLETTPTVTTTEPEPSPEPSPVLAEQEEPTASPETEPSPEYKPDPDDVTMLAKLVYGESRGIESITEQAAVIWTVLNRVDSTGYGMGKSVKRCVTFRDQFHGYKTYHPTVDDFGRDLCELAEDVLIRWMKEHDGQADVGRVLPAEFKWFDGDGQHNHFRDAYKRSQANYYGWHLPSPYES